MLLFRSGVVSTKDRFRVSSFHSAYLCETRTSEGNRRPSPHHIGNAVIVRPEVAIILLTIWIVVSLKCFSNLFGHVEWLQKAAFRVFKLSYLMLQSYPSFKTRFPRAKVIITAKPLYSLNVHLKFLFRILIPAAVQLAVFEWSNRQPIAP